MRPTEQRLPRAMSSAVLALILASCAHPYVPPRAGEPFALVKVRYIHHSRAGTGGGSGLTIDGHVLSQNVAPMIGQPEMRVHRVHPRPATFGARTEFYHPESQMERVAYQETETYSCQQYTPSYGTSGYSSGSYQSSTCTRSVTRYRNELRTVNVVDASCGSRVRWAPEAGHTYVLQYEYRADGNCRLACFEQVEAAGAAGFTMNRCRELPLPR